MNLAQMRIAVRDILTAGGGMNTVISNDDFWSDSEINLALNRAQDEIYKVIRRARADYFTRILRTTDPVLVLRGQRFDPASLRWVARQGNYNMPVDFVRMKLITDLAGDRVRVSASDLAKSEFRILMNENSSGTSKEYLYDILGVRTLVIRPVPGEERDFEFIYEKSLQAMRDYAVGTITAFEDNTTGHFSSGITSMLNVGDEVIVNSTKPDPNTQYDTIKSIDSSTQITIEGYWLNPNSDLAGGGGPTPYLVSSVSEIPRHHHHLLVAYAAAQCFMKGTNPHMECVSLWRNEYDSMLPSLINEVETRQGSDIETADAYLEDTYD